MVPLTQGSERSLGPWQTHEVCVCYIHQEAIGCGRDAWRTAEGGLSLCGLYSGQAGCSVAGL